MMNLHLSDVSDLQDYIKYIINTHEALTVLFFYSCLNQYN